MSITTHQYVPEVIKIFAAEIAEVQVDALRQQRVRRIARQVQVEAALEGTCRRKAVFAKKPQPLVIILVSFQRKIMALKYRRDWVKSILFLGQYQSSNFIGPAL